MKKLTAKILVLCSVFGFLFVLTPLPAHAQPDLRAQIESHTLAGANKAGLGGAAPQDIAARTIQVILSIVGITFTILMVMAGYNLLTAAGDESKVEKAKKTIKAAVIGIALTLGAYSITTFIGQSAVEITNEAPKAPETGSGASDWWEMLSGGEPNNVE